MQFKPWFGYPGVGFVFKPWFGYYLNRGLIISGWFDCLGVVCAVCMRVHPNPSNTERQVFRQPPTKLANTVDISTDTGVGLWGKSSTHAQLEAQGSVTPNHK